MRSRADAEPGRPARTRLPPRIWICGPSGSGKSFVADRIARRLGVVAVHMDDLHWKPGWVESPPEETRLRLDALTAGPRWVVEGNYSQQSQGLRSRADLVIWLDLDLRVTFPRVVGRSFRRWWRRELCCNGNRELLRKMLLSRESILLWSLTSHRPHRRRYAVELAGLPTIRLRTPREVAGFLADAAPDVPDRPS